ncbi:MAG: hypothetical protein LC791_12145 [Acidobacteria bacterium]|nr:hypothetical protein [Acidobacteriota bacterium]
MIAAGEEGHRVALASHESNPVASSRHEGHEESNDAAPLISFLFFVAFVIFVLSFPLAEV